MNTLTVTLPDGSQKMLPSGTRPLDVAQSISPRLADAAIAVLDALNEELVLRLQESGVVMPSGRRYLPFQLWTKSCGIKLA